MEKNKRIFSVSELSSLLQRTIDDNPVLAGFWVRGEISNFKKHTSGHFYFSLKDQKSNIRAVMFKSRTWTVNFSPRDGMDCLIRGYLAVYQRETQIQLYVEEIIPAGEGLYSLALEELKQKLKEKGYFSPERKRKLPSLPQGIGVVTSPVGAAIRDIIKVIGRRYPGMPLLLYPALVQGEQAASSIMEGLRMLSARDDIDVIILARGGGSKEDLRVFDSELVAEAVFQSAKPVISAVGHEIDVTIVDLVADVRAATPSNAGEIAVPVKDDLLLNLFNKQSRLHNKMHEYLKREQLRLNYLAQASIIKKPERWLNAFLDDVVKLERNQYYYFNEFFNRKKNDFQLQVSRLHILSPLSTLERGYSLTKNMQGQVVSTAEQVSIKEKVDVILAKGILKCQVVAKEDGDDYGEVL